MGNEFINYHTPKSSFVFFENGWAHGSHNKHIRPNFPHLTVESRCLIPRSFLLEFRYCGTCPPFDHDMHELVVTER
jgi:phosphatidylethanolamine-binding protein (PEBP) family uncharacterized protein